jgi:hypothetical protein
MQLSATPEIERAACPKCSTRMRLAVIEPGQPGYDTHTFECAQCEHSERVVIQFK